MGVLNFISNIFSETTGTHQILTKINNNDPGMTLFRNSLKEFDSYSGCHGNKTEKYREPLTLSQTSPGFYVSAVQVF